MLHVLAGAHEEALVAGLHIDAELVDGLLEREREVPHRRHVAHRRLRGHDARSVPAHEHAGALHDRDVDDAVRRQPRDAGHVRRIDRGVAEDPAPRVVAVLAVEGEGAVKRQPRLELPDGTRHVRAGAARRQEEQYAATAQPLERADRGGGDLVRAQAHDGAVDVEERRADHGPALLVDLYV